MKLKDRKIGSEEEILVPLRKILLEGFQSEIIGYKYPEYIRAEIFRIIWKKIKFNFNRNKKILILYNLEIALHLLKEDPSSIDRISFFTSSEAIHIFMTKNGFNSILDGSDNGENLLTNFQYSSFDLIIGNPPYTKGPNKHFYKKFIENSQPLLKKGGTLSLVTPNVWIEKKDQLFKEMLKDGYFSTIQKKKAEDAFYVKVNLGTPVSWFVWTNGGERRGISQEAENNITEEETQLEVLVRKIMGREIKEQKGQKGELYDYSKVSQGDFIYPVFLGSGEERSLVYDSKLPKGTGISKLIVSDIIEPMRAERFSEISSEKGVGRYSHFFAFSPEEALNARGIYNLQTYVFINSVKRSGRYAYRPLPELDYSKPWTDEEIWKLRGLTEEEIEIIKSAVPTAIKIKK
jgi:hypothetical protein